MFRLVLLSSLNVMERNYLDGVLVRSPPQIRFVAGSNLDKVVSIAFQKWYMQFTDLAFSTKAMASRQVRLCPWEKNYNGTHRSLPDPWESTCTGNSVLLQTSNQNMSSYA